MNLSKQALLEHIDREIIIVRQQEDVVMTAIMKAHWKGTLESLKGIRLDVASGRFDTEGEVQRLRAALEKVKGELRWGDAENAIDRVERIINEALSTTEPKGIKVGIIGGGNSITRAVIKALAEVESDIRKSCSTFNSPEEFTCECPFGECMKEPIAGM